MRDGVRIGLVGAGFAGGFHLAAYQRVSRIPVEIVGITSRTGAAARVLADRYNIRRVYPDFPALLANPDIDVVDLCVPVHLHGPMAIAAARAGKHVICEKPLLGFAGEGRTGAASREQMYATVRRELEEVAVAFRESGRKLLYAENWVYAPAFRRLADLVQASGGTILEIRGHESHGGSTSPFSRRWETSGGGSLLRLGIHPLSASIYLKQSEGGARDGAPRRVREVWAQTADLTKVNGFDPSGTRLASGWEDVENWAVGVVTFDDNSTALITCSDISLGGISNGMEVLLTNAHLRCRISPSNMCEAFAPGSEVFDNVFLNEKLETNSGWSFPAVDHNWESGYTQELQDFVEAVAEDRTPLSGLDLALESVRVAYALYWSAEEGRRIRL